MRALKYCSKINTVHIITAFYIKTLRTAAYQQSFYSRTIKEWNHLPQEIIDQDNLNLFTDKLLHYYIVANYYNYFHANCCDFFFFLGKSAELPAQY